LAIIKDVLKNENGDNITIYIEVDDEKISPSTSETDSSFAPRAILPGLAQDGCKSQHSAGDFCITLRENKQPGERLLNQ
jgi:hypothetical protein